MLLTYDYSPLFFTKNTRNTLRGDVYNANIHY